MYFKVVYNGSVLDVLDTLRFVRYDARHNNIIGCDEEYAEGFLSSDRTKAYRIEGMAINGKEFDTVVLVRIDKAEYDAIKPFRGQTKEEIIDEYNKMLIEMGVL